ncbi:MAG: addiction module antidote protein [Gallionellaceae bacterium]
MKTTKTKKTAKPHRTHDEATVESFRRDPKFAAAYLNAVLNDGDRAEIMTALRYVTEAFGGVPGIAQKTNLNATTLYRTLSAEGNPELKSFMEIMKAVGMRILVEPLSPARR